MSKSQFSFSCFLVSTSFDPLSPPASLSLCLSNVCCWGGPVGVSVTSSSSHKFRVCFSGWNIKHFKRQQQTVISTTTGSYKKVNYSSTFGLSSYRTWRRWLLRMTTVNIRQCAASLLSLSNVLKKEKNIERNRRTN